MSRERIFPFTGNEEDLRQLDNLSIKARDVVAWRTAPLTLQCTYLVLEAIFAMPPEKMGMWPLERF